jgi:hypothetical protein
MVTLTIMGFVLLMIFGAFRLGIAAWEKGETSKEEYQRTRIASQLISQQMKSAVPYKVKTQKAEGDYLVFEGKARSLKFVSTLSLKGKKGSGLVYAFYALEGEGEAVSCCTKGEPSTRISWRRIPRKTRWSPFLRGWPMFALSITGRKTRKKTGPGGGWRSGAPRRRRNSPRPCG